MLIYFNKKRILDGLLQLELQESEKQAVKNVLRGSNEIWVPHNRGFTFKQKFSTVVNISKRKKLLSTLLQYIILNRKEDSVQKANQTFNYFFELEYEKINRPEVRFGRIVPNPARDNRIKEYQEQRFRELQLEDFDDIDLLPDFK